MGNITYPGMRGPPELVGQYYALEGIRIITGEKFVLYFRNDGNIQLRDKPTGKFVSRESALELLARIQTK